MEQYTEHQIETGNKLIAEYLGYQYFPYSDDTKGQLHGWVKRKGLPHSAVKISNHGDIGKRIYLARTTNDLKFDRDWHWLMTALQIIRKRVFAIELCFCLGTIVKIRYGNEWHTYESNSNMDPIWTAIVDFIIWSNSSTTDERNASQQTPHSSTTA